MGDPCCCLIKCAKQRAGGGFGGTGFCPGGAPGLLTVNPLHCFLVLCKTVSWPRLAFIFYLFYPGKLRLIGWSIFWTVFFAVVPLTVVGDHSLLFLCKERLHLLVDDRSASVGLSVMGLLETWFHLTISKNVVALAGMVLFLLPLIHVQSITRTSALPSYTFLRC